MPSPSLEGRQFDHAAFPFEPFPCSSQPRLSHVDVRLQDRGLSAKLPLPMAALEDLDARPLNVSERAECEGLRGRDDESPLIVRHHLDGSERSRRSCTAPGDRLYQAASTTAPDTGWPVSDRPPAPSTGHSPRPALPGSVTVTAMAAAITRAFIERASP